MVKGYEIADEELTITLDQFKQAHMAQETGELA